MSRNETFLLSQHKENNLKVHRKTMKQRPNKLNIVECFSHFAPLFSCRYKKPSTPTEGKSPLGSNKHEIFSLHVSPPRVLGARKAKIKVENSAGEC